MTLQMKTYILAALAALVLSAPRTAVAGSIKVQGLNIDATTAWALSAGDDRDKLDAAITNEVDPVAMEALKGYATTGQLAIATANLDETDPRDMKLYHYGDPDIQITPESDFGFDAGSGTITGYTGTNPDVVLPYEIGGVPVVAIGVGAFDGNGVIRKLIAPKTLTTIGNYAFAGTALETLIAPSLTTIGDSAFYYGLLTSLAAPALTTIGNYAFYGTPLTSLVAPALTTIGDSAFHYSSLTAIYYGGNQPTADAGIYDYAHPDLISYVTNPTATGWGDFFGGKPVVRLPLYADEVHIGGELAATQPYVTNAIAGIPPVVIPDEQDPIFTAWDKTTGISITENQVTDLKVYATETYVDNAISNIPAVVIPDETDPRAMRLYHYGDPDIQITPESDFTFNAANGTITGYTGTNGNIVLPYEIGGVPVVTIGVRAFDMNNVVKTLKAPKTLTSIGGFAFAGSYLTTLTAPSLTTIGGFAFADCPLTTLVAPSLTSIGGYAFSDSPLTTLVAPSLTSIGDFAFYGSALETLTAPSLTSIGNYAFAYGPLTAIYYGSNQPTAGANIYQDTPTNLVNYVTNPTATGWGDTFGDRPVVRLPLYADEVYIKGSLAATQPYVTNAIANIPPVVIPDETDPVFTAWDKSTGITITENQVTDLKVYATETYVGDAIANIPPVVIPDETDPRAMKLYHYGDPDIQITPESDFGFNAASGAITSYTGTDEDIIVPYEIGGVPVVAIGANVFNENKVVETLIAPRTLTTIGNEAFGGSSLTTLTAPSLTSIGDYVFVASSLSSLIVPTTLTTIGNGAFAHSPLTSIYYGGNQPTADEGIYEGAPANLINYVTDPTATGWGDTFGDRPVVRLPLYADEVYSGGSLVSTVSPSSPWTTNIVASGTQTLKGTWGSQPRLQLSGSTTVDIDWTTYDTNGINRISLTIVSGEHPVIWLTDNIEFEEVPELSTNAPNTILIRKIGAAKAQGRQL